jgi:hypothetical protein
VTYHLLLQPPAVEELDQAFAHAFKQAPLTAVQGLERFGI